MRGNGKFPPAHDAKQDAWSVHREPDQASSDDPEKPVDRTSEGIMLPSDDTHRSTILTGRRLLAARIACATACIAAVFVFAVLAS